MAHRIPSADVLSMAIVTAFGSCPRMDSQRELVRRVGSELRKYDPDYRISGQRIRRIGVERNLFKITVEYHETDGPLPDVCPVCGNAMKPIMNMTLEGTVTEIRRICKVCSFNLNGKSLIPGRYSFQRTRKQEISEKDAVIRKMEKAQARIREAVRIMDEAVKMTGLEHRWEEHSVTLRMIADSKDRAGTIPNLMDDYVSIEDAPGWTRPLVSVKNVPRKDI